MSSDESIYGAANNDIAQQRAREVAMFDRQDRQQQMGRLARFGDNLDHMHQRNVDRYNMVKRQTYKTSKLIGLFVLFMIAMVITFISIIYWSPKSIGARAGLAVIVSIPWILQVGIMTWYIKYQKDKQA